MNKKPYQAIPEGCRYDVPMEGACEASLACVTCHCYVEDEAMFDMVRGRTVNRECTTALEKEDFLDIKDYEELPSSPHHPFSQENPESG